MKPKVWYEAPYWRVLWQQHEYHFHSFDLAQRFVRVVTYGAIQEVP